MEWCDINMLRPITEEYIKPEVGTLIMFFGWLRHGVMVHSLVMFQMMKEEHSL